MFNILSHTTILVSTILLTLALSLSAKAQSRLVSKSVTRPVSLMERAYISTHYYHFIQEEKSLLIQQTQKYADIHQDYDSNFIPSPLFCPLEEYFRLNYPSKGYFHTLTYRPKPKKKIDPKSKLKLKVDLMNKHVLKGSQYKKYRITMGVRFNKPSSNLINFAFRTNQKSCTNKCLK